MPVAIPVGIVALLVALVVLIFLLASVPLGKLLAAVFRQIPVVGGTIANAIETATQVAYQSALAYVDSTAPALGRWLWSAVVVIWTWAGGIADGIYEAKAAFITLDTWLNTFVDALYAYVNADFSQLDTWLNTYVNYLEAYATAEVGALGGAITSEISTLYAYVDAEATQLDNWLNTFVSALYADIASTAAQLSTTIEGKYDEVLTYVDQEISKTNADVTAVETYLSGLVGTAETEAVTKAAALATGASAAAVAGLDAAAHDVVIGPWSVLLPKLGTIVGAIPGVAADALGLPAAITGADLTTVAGILSALVPAVGAIAEEVADCGVPLCSNLSGLSGLLQTILSDVYLAALLAFIVEAAAQPEATATDIESVVGPIVSDIASGARDLIGV